MSNNTGAISSGSMYTDSTAYQPGQGNKSFDPSDINQITKLLNEFKIQFKVDDNKIIISLNK